MISISHVMTKKVAAVYPESTVADTIRFLTENHIGGAPVVDRKGQLVGMISELALIDVVFDEKVASAPISKYMTIEVQVVSPHDSLARAAQLFALYAFRRLPVVDNGKLVGIITRRDLMNYSLQSEQVMQDPLAEMIPLLALAP